MNIYAMVLIAVVLGGGIIFFARLAKLVGTECVFCGGCALMMNQLPEDDRAKIRHYFWQAENRVPYAETVYVCTECHKVNDDRITSHNPRGIVIRCKVCGKTTNFGATMTCHVCKTNYKWGTFTSCGPYRFLLPTPKDAPEST